MIRVKVALLVPFLVGTAAASPALPEQSARETLVQENLHPVREQVLATWQRETRRAMSGPRASPYFRDLANRMDVTWRLRATQAFPQPLSIGLRDQVLQQSIDGGAQGWRATFRKSVARHEELSQVFDIASMATGPRLSFRQKKERVRIEVDEDAGSMEAQTALLEQGADEGLANRPSKLSTGGGLHLVQRSDPEAPETLRILPAATSYIRLQNVGLHALQIHTLLINDPSISEERPHQLIGSWRVAGRQQLVPGLSAVGQGRGRLRTGQVNLASAGLEWRIPGEGRFVTRAQVSRLRIEEVDRLDRRAELVLRTNLRWRVPSDIDRWPLGQEPGAPGPWLPEVPDAGPMAMTPLSATPAERSGGPGPIDHATADAQD